MEADIAATINGAGPLCRQLNQLYSRYWHESMAGFEVTGPQYTVLALLAMQGPLDQRTLGGLASLDKSTAAPLLNRLWERGLIGIERDDRDKRRKVISVTSQGQALVSEIAPLVPSVEEKMLASLSGSETATFLALARRIILT